MSIVLTEVRITSTGHERVGHREQGSVLHFGSDPPPSKQQPIVVRGRDVAPHHAKLFFSQGQFWLLNLCGLPCTVLKASGRTVFLTTSDPAIEIQVGETFRIGDSVFVIDAMSTPQRPFNPLTLAAPEAELVRQMRDWRIQFEPRDIRGPGDPMVWEAALRFSSRLSLYTEPDEIWRRTVDEAAGTFAERWQGASPVALLAIALRVGGGDGDGTAAPTFDETIYNCPIPASDRLAGEEEDPFGRTGIAPDLIRAAGDIAREEPVVLHFRCPSDPAAAAKDVFASAVMEEENTVGVLVLVACRADSSHMASLDDLYLFDHHVRSLGLSLTFLEQRRRALEYAGTHDVGQAALETMHDGAHLIELAEFAFQDMTPVIHHLAETHSKDVDTLSACVERVRTVCRQAAGIAKTTVRFARHAHRHLPLNLSVHDLVDCNRPLSDWLDTVEWLVHDKLVCVAAAFELGEVPFWADVNPLLATLRNLQSNAVEALRYDENETFRLLFTARCQSLETEAHRADYVVVSVADSGRGVPDGVRERLFRDRVADSASGHGLGTQIVRRVIDEHRGLIWFASKAQVGTVVELWYPRLIIDPGLGEDERHTRVLQQWEAYQMIREQFGSVDVIDNEEDVITQALNHPLFTR